MININRTKWISFKEFKRIVKDKNTINLLNKEQTKRLGNKIRFGEYGSRAERRKEEDKNLKAIAGTFLLLGLIILILISFFNRPVEAFENPKVVNISKEVIKPLKTQINTYTEDIKEVKEVKKNINDLAFEFIIQFEGYHDKPYWDYKQWSCGYGMKCSQFTTGITREKSKEFVIERIIHIRKVYELSQYEDWLEVALISFIYNIWSPPIWYKRYIENWYTNALKNRFKQYSYAGNSFLRGLYKRRVAECNLF